MLDCAGDMVLRRWRDGTVRDVYSEFNRLTLRVTLEALFGARLAAGDESAGREITGGCCSARIALVACWKPCLAPGWRLGMRAQDARSGVGG